MNGLRQESSRYFSGMYLLSSLRNKSYLCCLMYAFPSKQRSFNELHCRTTFDSCSNVLSSRPAFHKLEEKFTNIY